MTLQKFQTVRQYAEPRLRIRLRLFSLICLIMIGIVTFDLLRHGIGIGLAFVGILLGMLIGAFMSRVYRLNWDEKTFRKLMASPPERLVSSFRMRHGLLLNVHGRRDEDGCAEIRRYLERGEMRPTQAIRVDNLREPPPPRTPFESGWSH